MKKTEPEYYPPVENLLDLIYEHYTENNPVEKNTVAGKAAKEKEKELEESNRILNERNQVLSALSRDYTTVLLCDLRQDTFEVVKGDTFTHHDPED